MRWVFALVALCGCNEILGINPTIAVDAQLFDSPIDAPFECPALGTAPEFSRLFHQVTTHYCSEYAVSKSAGRAVANCFEIGLRGISEGTPDADDLHSSVGFESPPEIAFDAPRLTPEGDELFLRRFDQSSATYTVYRREANAWVHAMDLPIPATSNDFFSGVTRGPLRRMFILITSVLHEYASDGSGGWAEVRTHSPAAFELEGVFNASITADGLRVVMTGYSQANPNSAIYYADRPDVTSPFSPAIVLKDVPVSFYVSMTEDCSRLYFSALQSVFYVQRL